MAVGSRGHRVLLEDGQGLGPRPGCSEVTAAAQPVSLSLHHVQQSCAERPQTTDSARCRGGPALVPANLTRRSALHPVPLAACQLPGMPVGDSWSPARYCHTSRGPRYDWLARSAPGILDAWTFSDSRTLQAIKRGVSGAKERGHTEIGRAAAAQWPLRASRRLWSSDDLTPRGPQSSQRDRACERKTTATAATITSVTTTKAIFMTSKIVTTTTTVVIFITSNITTNTTIAIFMTSNFVTTTTTIITTITIIIFLTSNIFTTTTIPTFITSNITTNTTITIFTTTTTTATFITSNITTNTCITSNITTNTTFITSSIVTTIATTVTAFITSNIITTTFFTSNITTNTFSPPTSHQHLYQHHSLQNHLHHLIITTDTLSGPTCFITKMWVNVLGSGSPGKQRPYIPV
uniref:Uncharacterized protein n=1 Tax=Rangifer tarandus platyrhynchus TaxID=3082113 RepID=A0ACB0F6Q1_RANTA|nr:unnamed protein product [Rangifer tarandus platyrhynchus]